MNVGALAFACYIYDRTTNYDRAYLDFLDEVSSPPDLTSQRETLNLIKWLNRWGCRQFSREGRLLACRHIQSWYSEYADKLVPPRTELVDLTEAQINDITPPFNAITSQIASLRHSRVNRELEVKVGPTGASKILFALRPEAYPAWDQPIRGAQQNISLKSSYSEFLQQGKKELLELRNECQRHGISFQDLPGLLGRPKSTHAKLLDEYNWISVTRNCVMPEKDTLMKWLSWDRRP